MSALAGIVSSKGALVSGCDRADNEQTEKLESLGIEVAIGHSAAHAEDCDLLVFTSAVAENHPERLAAGTKAIRRGKFLAQIMAEYRGVGIAGTHGKTSTTWMAAYILLHNGLDPTVLLGGVTSEMDGNYRCGGDIFVSELDESDGSFLLPELEVAVITNIESEHLAYYHTSEKVVEAFELFAEKNNTGLLITGIDNEYCAQIYAGHQGRKEAFGLNTGGIGLYAEDITSVNGVQQARILYNGVEAGILCLPLCGRHNILNALAALLVGREFGVSLEQGIETLAGIETVGRRMEFIHEVAGARIFSDYAHHPTEVRAALAGARELDGSGKILAVFQPHLYSRTRDYAAEFAQELAGADMVAVAEIYPAREEPIAGVDSELIREYIRRIGGTVAPERIEVADITEVIRRYAPDYSTIICIGAGNIDAEVRKIADE